MVERRYWPAGSRALTCIAVACMAYGALAAQPAEPLATSADPRITAMKGNPRGPFQAIRWFCKDGTQLPARPNNCDAYGGGEQHGLWSDDTVALRTQGYAVATVYADLDIDALMARNDLRAQLAQMAIERYLIASDDGWILRRARGYRGAFQEESERRGAATLLRRIAVGAAANGEDFLLVRTFAALLPHGALNISARTMRQQASALGLKDPDFMPLRNRIHAAPSADDAAAVRAYAARISEPELAAEYVQLARSIEDLFNVSTSVRLATLRDQFGAAEAPLAAALDAYLASAARDHPARLATSAALLHALRGAFFQLGEGASRLAVIDASLAVEADYFAAASALASASSTRTRRQQLEYLAHALAAAYGSGLLSARELAAQQTALARFAPATLDLARYRREVEYLGLVPSWGDRHVSAAFGPGLQQLARIEPLARVFPQDHLRGSPLFHFARTIDGLQRDANGQSGVRHRLFDRDVASGLRALNPGLVRGVLRDGRTLAAHAMKADGIYLLPATVADLPPVAGILTAGEGNPLSHVQLLARNLGIPNVAVDTALLESLAQEVGRAVVLAVSAGGAVHLLADGADFDQAFARGAAAQRHIIEPELDKLKLDQRELIDLATLRAADSGRTVGPKAAKLGELKAHYPDAVANGIALPFGLFRATLERPSPTPGQSMFDYIVAGYRALDALAVGSTERERATQTLRDTIESWVQQATLEPALAAELRARLRARLGADGSFGVFVRSDTNVEDLPGFTGAGLNLTLPNVVGMDAITAAIPRVWASPFTARAFAWRQALMKQPEHVYPAVLLLESVNVEKSGVLVTQDIDTGDRTVLSVAINEGVGGAVDGQSAESLRIDTTNGAVRLLAQASALYRRQCKAGGGIEELPVSGRDEVLSAHEITQLIAFARELPQKFPPIVDANGQPAPADVEFGFLNGALRLFQIRPFLDNPAARRNHYLIGMDPPAAALAAITIDLEGVLP